MEPPGERHLQGDGRRLPEHAAPDLRRQDVRQGRCRGRPEGGSGDHGKADLVIVKRQEAVLAYAFLAPWIVGFLAFVAGPILASLYLSLTRYDIATPPRFLGGANYVQAFA